MNSAQEFVDHILLTEMTTEEAAPLLEARDAEWQLRVDAAFAMGRKEALDTARREGWEAGVRAALDVHQEHPPSEHYEASQEITALIARGTK